MTQNPPFHLTIISHGTKTSFQQHLKPRQQPQICYAFWHYMHSLSKANAKSCIQTRQFIINTCWYSAAESREEQTQRVYCIWNETPSPWGTLFSLRSPFPPMGLRIPARQTGHSHQLPVPCPLRFQTHHLLTHHLTKKLEAEGLHSLFSHLSHISYPLWRELPWKMDLRTPFAKLFPFSTSLEDF